MSNRGLRTAVPVTLLACVVGLGLGLLVAHILRPSEEDIRSAARSLVPPGAEIVNDTEVTGSPLIVGGYSQSVEFQGGAQGDDQFLAAVERTAADGSWTESAREQAPGATTITFEHDGVMAVVQVLRNRGRVGGEVDARGDTGAQDARRNIAGLAGVVVVGGGTALIIWLRRGRRLR